MVVVVVWAALAAVGIVGFVVLPRVVFALAVRGRGRPTWAPWLLWAAVALFVVSWLLPSPSRGGTETFTQHAVGGGAASAVMATWFAVNAGVRSAVVRMVVVYAVTCSLGVAVELGELVLDELAGTRLAADAAWDLLANTTGALAAAVMLEAALAVATRRR